MAETLSATTRRRLRTTAGTPKVHRRNRSARLLPQAKVLDSAKASRSGQTVGDRCPRPRSRLPDGLEVRSTLSMGLSPLSCQRVHEIATPAALDPGGT